MSKERRQRVKLMLYLIDCSYTMHMAREPAVTDSKPIGGAQERDLQP